MTAPEIEIRDLATCDGAVDVILRWYLAEWPAWYGPGGQGDAAADLEECQADAAALPRCLVAVGRDGSVLGSACLRQTSLGADRFSGPWLTALFVDPQHRRRGIATALVSGVEDAARRRGFALVSVATDTGQDLVRRCGWRRVGAAQSLRGPVGIFQKRLI